MLGLASHRPDQPVIVRHRIRVPQQNKTALHLPPLSQAPNKLKANRDRIRSQAALPLEVSFLSEKSTLGQLQKQARHEVTKLAVDYSSQYLPHCDSISLTDQPIIMSGHQPVLYHAGVWYKNFVLSEFSNRTDAIAVNLVVDTDLSNQHSIRFPDLSSTPLRTRSIEIDKPAPTVPHEHHSIQNPSFLFATLDRFTQAFPNVDQTSILQRLWPEIIQAYHELTQSNSTPPALGATLAAGRHRFEQSIGLKNLEVSVSQLSQTTAFAIFAAMIFDRANEFRQTYNQVLLEYRNANRIRSSSHPVPKLEQTDDWTEVPFWVLSDHTPGRQRLFIRNRDAQIELSDRQQLHQILSKSDFIAAFNQLSTLGISIRPRAISTTMFCRLLMSDIFIHGVGGAKYDQLTDAICERFFGYVLPEILTVSATFRLPNQVPRLTKADITNLETHRRECNFHPERFLANEPQTPQAVALIKQKRQWIASTHIRTHEKHHAITQINRDLRAMLTPSDDQLKSEIESLNAQLKSSQIANSREYSFCLFGESLIGDLKQLVQTNLA